MKAITIWQPYATLLVSGRKKFETRSWATKYRGPMLLAAAAKRVQAVLRILPPPLVTHIRNTMYTPLEDLPTGALLATAELVECHLITKQFLAALSGEELLLGDFTLGRFAWEFREYDVFPEPIPAKGGQRLWEYTGRVPNEK